MKKIFRNSRLITIALVTVFSAAVSLAAMADPGKELPVELKYVGGFNNHSIIQLNITGNELENDFVIIIRDEYGNNIYRQNIKGEKISKKFLFDTNELGDDTLEFEVFCRKTNKSVLYKVNRQTRQTENMVINKLY